MKVDWKRADKELPTKRGRYLVYYFYQRAVFIIYWDLEKRQWENGWNISHWAELPELPDENEVVEVGLNIGFMVESPYT